MRFAAFIFLILISLKGLSQKQLITSPESTSIIILEISKEWKKDSIGKKGFRSQVFERLRYSKIHNISKGFLFETLGKPHRISKFYNGNTHKNYVGFRYYVLCINDYPKEKHYEGSFIEFVFDEGERSLLKLKMENTAFK